MGKYGRLADHLKGLETNRWRADFSEIERIVGSKLPESAHRHQAWWANESTTHSHALAWLSSGWRTAEIDLGGEHVTFHRLFDGPNLRQSKISKVQKTDFPEPNTSPLWDAPQEVFAKIGLSWKPIGRVVVSGEKQLLFPTPPTGPGLYRFRIHNKGREARYVGETENLRRRFRNYRSPGKTQETSLRLNGHLLSELAAGAEIAVSIANSVFVTVKGTEKAIDLSNKAVRRLFENFAQVIEGDSDIETLNR